MLRVALLAGRELPEPQIALAPSTGRDELCNKALIGILKFGKIGGKEPSVPRKKNVGLRHGVSANEKVRDYPRTRPASASVLLPAQPRLIGNRGID